MRELNAFSGILHCECVQLFRNLFIHHFAQCSAVASNLLHFSPKSLYNECEWPQIELHRIGNRINAQKKKNQCNIQQFCLNAFQPKKICFHFRPYKLFKNGLLVISAFRFDVSVPSNADIENLSRKNAFRFTVNRNKSV